jgi:hypothetical protein
MDEAFYKGERRRAQKTSKVISGFGSQSFHHRAARQELPSTSKSDSELPEHDPEGGDSSALLVDEDDLPGSSKPDQTKKSFTYSDGDTSSPPSQNAFSVSLSAHLRQRRALSMLYSSTSSTLCW